MTRDEIDAAVLAAVKHVRERRFHCDLRWIAKECQSIEKRRVARSLQRMRKRGDVRYAQDIGWIPSSWEYGGEYNSWINEHGIAVGCRF